MTRHESASRRARVIGLLAAIIAALVAAASLQAEVLRSGTYGYRIDLPTGWYALDVSDPARVGFSDPQNHAVFQIYSYPRSRFADVSAVVEFMENRHGLSGDAVPFQYERRDAVLGDYRFVTAQAQARGYFTFLEYDEYFFVVVAFALEANYARLHDFLVSAIDSFAPGPAAEIAPGPISQFYYEHPGAMPVHVPLEVGGRTVYFATDPAEEDAAQVVVEREARILAQYAFTNNRGDPWVEAWRRFFRIVYRDNYSRIAPLAGELYRVFRADGVERDGMPAAILSWLQGFEYDRIATLSDLRAPLSCVLTLSGDCDSLGLTYVIFLHVLGFDAILMVSSEYSHALGAVDIPGPGARFEFEGTAYLVAELTDTVDIGLIPRDMADPAGWIGVKFR